MDYKIEWADRGDHSQDSHPERLTVVPRTGAAVVSFADAISALIGHVGRDRRIRFANKACDGWLGVASSQVCGRSVRDLVGPDFLDATESHVEAAFAGASVTFEIPAPFNTAILGRGA